MYTGASRGWYTATMTDITHRYRLRAAAVMGPSDQEDTGTRSRGDDYPQRVGSRARWGSWELEQTSPTGMKRAAAAVLLPSSGTCPFLTVIKDAKN